MTEFSQVPAPMSTETITEVLRTFSGRNIATLLRLENGVSVNGILELYVDGDDVMCFEVCGEQFFPICVEQIKIVDGCILSIALCEDDRSERAERDLCDEAYRNDLMGYGDGPDW